MKTIDKIPQKKKVILDIDLDYFACWDSIWNEMRYGLEITPEQFYNQEVFLRDKTLPFSRLEFQFVERNNKFYAEVGHRKGKELAHLPSKEEVEREIQTLVKTLAVKKVHPVVVTICRSCVSKYCPQDYVDFIEKRLAAQLRGLFPSGISPGRISCTPSKAKIRETRESEGKISSGERLDARPSAVD